MPWDGQRNEFTDRHNLVEGEKRRTETLSEFHLSLCSGRIISFQKKLCGTITEGTPNNWQRCPAGNSVKSNRERREIWEKGKPFVCAWWNSSEFHPLCERLFTERPLTRSMVAFKIFSQCLGLGHIVCVCVHSLNLACGRPWQDAIPFSFFEPKTLPFVSVALVNPIRAVLKFNFFVVCKEMHNRQAEKRQSTGPDRHKRINVCRVIPSEFAVII